MLTPVIIRDRVVGMDTDFHVRSQILQQAEFSVRLVARNRVNRGVGWEVVTQLQEIIDPSFSPEY